MNLKFEREPRLGSWPRSGWERPVTWLPIRDEDAMLLWRTLGWKLVKQPLSGRAKGYNNERNKLCSSKNAEIT